MFYRETGDFKTSYIADLQTFPIRLDRYRFWLMMAFLVFVMPFLITESTGWAALNGSYWEQSILLPAIIFAIAALGLNILTGYCGQISLGTGGFMAVGAFACYKLTTSFPEMDLVLIVFLSGAVTAAVGMAFGLPSLRIKGFYLAVATLAAQFFLIWMFNKFPWFYNHSATGQIVMPDRQVFGIYVTGEQTDPAATYLFCLAFLILFGFITRNLVRGRIGRSWMAIRDMDIAAEIIGVNPLRAKLSAFAVSSFMVGVSGALYFAVWKGAVEATEAFDILTISFPVLFMIIIGGLGSIQGSIMGAIFITLLPIVLKILMVDTLEWPTVLSKHLEFIILGGLIIFFLIVEPHGLARLWQIAKEKLRLWPFPH